MEFYFTEDQYLIPEVKLPHSISGGGKNVWDLTFLIGDEDNNPELLRLLKKIAESIGLNLQNQCRVCLIGKDSQYSILDFKVSGKHTKLISFGMHHTTLTTQFNKIPYKWLEFDQFEMLFTDSLLAISKDVKLKQMLWGALKHSMDNQ